jgi:hypothetical protein
MNFYESGQIALNDLLTIPILEHTLLDNLLGFYLSLGARDEIED